MLRNKLGVEMAVEVQTPWQVTRVHIASRVPRDPALVVHPLWLPSLPPWHARWLGMSAEEEAVAWDEIDRWRREAKVWLRKALRRAKKSEGAVHAS